MAKQTKKSPQEIKEIALDLLDKSHVLFTITAKKETTAVSNSPPDIADKLNATYDAFTVEIRPKKGVEILRVHYFKHGNEKYYVSRFASSPKYCDLDIVLKDVFNRANFRVYYRPK